jgi:hypothetical protein
VRAKGFIDADLNRKRGEEGFQIRAA